MYRMTSQLQLIDIEEQESYWCELNGKDFDDSFFKMQISNEARYIYKIRHNIYVAIANNSRDEAVKLFYKIAKFYAEPFYLELEMLLWEDLTCTK